MKTLIAVLTIGIAGCAAAPEGAIFTDAGTSSADAVCETANGGCGAHSVCHGDAAGSAVCTCDSAAGFEGDGFTCVDQLGALEGLRWELPCIQNNDPQPGTCSCATSPVVVSTTIGGVSSRQYAITLRFRGVVELRQYSGGTNDGNYWQIGGDTPSRDVFPNIYKLEISNPPQIYYLNRGSGLVRAIDYSKTVQATGGATFTLTADAVEGFEADNHPGANGTGTPIVVPDIAPAPSAFPGEFVQMDIVR